MSELIPDEHGVARFSGGWAIVSLEAKPQRPGRPWKWTIYLYGAYVHTCRRYKSEAGAVGGCERWLSRVLLQSA